MNKFIELFTEDGLSKQYHESIKPSHVFHELIAFYSDRLSDGDREMLLAAFNDSDVALGLARRRELEPAKPILERLTAQKMAYPDFMRSGVMSMITAVDAYYEYACGHNEEAIRMLEEAAGLSLTQSIDFPPMMTGSQDQWRNIAVVRSRQGDLNGALSELNGLLVFSLTGDLRGMGVEERFNVHAGGEIFNGFWQLDPEIQHLMLILIIGSSFRGVFEIFNNDFALAGELYSQIISHAACAMRGRRVVQWARSPIMLLHLYYTGHKDRFLEEICGQFDDIRAATPSLQWLIMSNYVILMREAGYEVETHPNYPKFLEVYMSLGFPTDLLKAADQEDFAAAANENAQI